MAIQLGSAYGKVNLDVKGLIDGVKQGKVSLQSLAAAGQAMGETLKNVGRNLTLVLTLPILAMGAAAINAAKDFEETKNKAIVVFAEMSDSVIKNSEKASTALGVSKQEYLDYASSIGAALSAGGMGISEATELSEQAVKHFADLASFHNTQVQDAALAWQSAIRGQYEPIQKYFPFITNQYLITYGTANGLIDANTKELTANQRAVILNAIALNNELNPALNDFAETSGGLANQQRILKAQFKDSLIMLGQNLLPIALEVTKGLNAMLTAFNNMPAPVQKAIIVLAGLVAVMGPVLSLIGTVVSFVSSIAGFASTLSGLGISLGSIATFAGTAGTALLGVGTAALSVIAPLLLIAATIYLVYLAFQNNFMGITTAAQQLWFIIKYYFAEGWKWLVNAVQQGGQIVGNWFKTMIQKIVAIFKGMKWSDLGKYIMLGLVNGLLMGIPLAVAAAVKAAQAIMKAFDSKLDINSPSGEFEKRGVYSMQGYLRGWGKMDPNSMAKQMANPVLNQSTSSQQNMTMHFANGLTVRQAQKMVDDNNQALFRTMNRALRSA